MAEVHIQGYYYNYSGSCKTYSGDLNWLIDASRGGRKVHSDGWRGSYLASFCACLPPAVFLIIIRKLEITPRHEVWIKIVGLFLVRITLFPRSVWALLPMPFYLIFASMHGYFYLGFRNSFAKLFIVVCILVHHIFALVLLLSLHSYSMLVAGTGS